MEKSSTATTCTKKDESCNKTRTRNTETTSSNEETMFFRDVKAFIIPSGIGHKRLELFQKQLTKYGGNVEQTLTEMTTHIIVDESIEWLKICKILKGNEIFSTLTKVGQTVNVVTTLWLSNSLKEKKYLDCKDFEIRKTNPAMSMTNEISSSSKQNNSYKSNTKPSARSTTKYESLRWSKALDTSQRISNCNSPNKKSLNMDQAVNQLNHIKTKNLKRTSETLILHSQASSSNVNVLEDIDILANSNSSNTNKQFKYMDTKVVDTESLFRSDIEDGDYNLTGEGKEMGSDVISPNIANTNKNKRETSPANLSMSDKWVCARSSRQQTTNLNYDITVKLEVLAETYKNTKDQWRALGYQKAISALKNHHKKITTWEEARSLPGIGTQLADKIWEIIQSGHLRKIDEVCCSERNSAIGLFTKVWGAGPSTAELWVQQGFRTLKDLKTKAKLSRQQQIGLKYFDEIQDRMSREEAGEIFNTVQESAWLVQPELECIACGSYRRGKSNCGDLDVLITHPDGKSHVGVLPKIVALLHSTGFLTDDLVSCVETGNQKKYMGICKLSGVNKKHRRLDIIVAPKSEFACALLYFTGSAHFNRSMRLLARRKGMALSESSLREGVIRKGQEHIMEGYPLPTLTEESIFDYLGLEYRAPEERDH
ncbi:DNA polymerase lambda-like isoform X1 [Limulus polyphemus]|uniref:DNA polymerase lambda n=1 Tax=Limulus polyphemus TaxID=6850 RepID=A0ABM1BDF3_LIMPO|nr:DNA polymerase lambda-like isoform X1 [Limulus polyphemus]